MRAPSKSKTLPKITKLPRFTHSSMISETKMIFSDRIFLESTKKILKESEGSSHLLKFKWKIAVLTALLNFSLLQRSKHNEHKPKAHLSSAKLNSKSLKPTPTSFIKLAQNRSINSSKPHNKRTDESPKSLRSPNKCTTLWFSSKTKTNSWENSTSKLSPNSRHNRNNSKVTKLKFNNSEMLSTKKERSSSRKGFTFRPKEKTVRLWKGKSRGWSETTTGWYKRSECYKKKRTAFTRSCGARTYRHWKPRKSVQDRTFSLTLKVVKVVSVV